ncbi:hypothetical protein DFH09DRAFT_1091024 [Mycena vulgaris]|nr:hypothetical protein DFH09DRAFT_1091024 [Mycena vulgaris]
MASPPLTESDLQFSEFFAFLALAGSGESERIHRLRAHNLTPTTRSCLLYLLTGDYGQELVVIVSLRLFSEWIYLPPDRKSGGDGIGENTYMLGFKPESQADNIDY